MNGAKGRWNGAGTWTLTGRAVAYDQYINSGALIIGENGSIKSSNRELRLESAATLHYNNPGAVEYGAAFGIRGNIDNTSGAAITLADTDGLVAGLGIDNDLVIERDSNTVSDLFDGITLTLFQAEEGTRIKLDDYQYKNLHLIIGAIAARLHPDDWDAEARPVAAEEPKPDEGELHQAECRRCNSAGPAPKKVVEEVRL